VHTVIETHAFERGAKDVGLTEEEVHQITVFLSQNPMAGDVMKGTGGARKLRFALKDKGKSGGVRVITYYAAEDVPVFLLDVFSKNEKINLTKGERNELKAYLSGLADDYREQVKRQLGKVGRAS